MSHALILLTAPLLAPLAGPTKAPPKEITIHNVAPHLRHTFPANSVTVLRLGNY